jgi:hypothetical protein
MCVIIENTIPPATCHRAGFMVSGVCCERLQLRHVLTTHRSGKMQPPPMQTAGLRNCISTRGL